jgi:hypothetical protein
VGKIAPLLDMLGNAIAEQAIDANAFLTIGHESKEE